MRQVLLVDGIRTAIGKMNGALSDAPSEALAELMIREGLNRTGIGPEQVDEVIFGHSKQSGDQPNIARLAALMAGLPVTVPAYTVHRQCGSGMQAVHCGAQQISCGFSEVVLAGGVESMTNAPYYLRQARSGYRAGNGVLVDPNTESQLRSQPVAQYGELTMGLTAENLAEKYRISREEQDEFAYHSQQKTAQAMKNGRFAAEITPVMLKNKYGSSAFDTDEHPRLSSPGELAKLNPAFKKNGTVTAGNSSGRNDGAALLVLASEEKARELSLKPKARIVAQASAGVSPDIMGIGPVPATQKALKQAGLSLSDMGLIELNEAFAAQSLAVLREWKIPLENINVNGGAIALGHPIGCTGARILVTLLHEMERRDVRYGLATLCIGGGMGSSTILERIK